ncbi:hypothetical protein FHU38_004989 [Saccharomonospora amisosensis]|uniref:PPE domain-containing protein n=1 Tax=Saccharomonospora amisosensis TaxID=1128677 RepID=A0A7X5ZT49_9PSEU|nr:hypothetical protein [Saccharomonospora amisosensis]NIJ14588.1 hypothetical protein [Saccharomonospora amisosensis]
MTSARPGQPTAQEFLDMPAEEVRNYLQSGQEPPPLSEAQIQRLPASQVEPYLQARVNAGDAGIFERFADHLRASSRADEISEQRIREGQSGDVEYMGGVPSPDGNYLGEDHQRLKEYLAAVDPAQVETYSDGYYDLHKLFQDLADALKESVGKSQQGWEGEAADQAHNYFTGLSTWADGNSQNAQLASDIIHQESEAASTARNSMPEPVPFSWDTEMQRWGDDPFNVVGNVSKSIETYNQSKQAHEQAAQVMTRYDTDLHDAGNKQPVFAEPPRFGEGGSGEVNRPVPTVQQPGGGQGTNPSGYQGGGVPGGSVPGGGGSGSFSPGGSTPGGSGSLPGGVSTGVGPMPSGTRPSGYRSPSIPRSRVPGGGGNTQGIGAMPMPGMVPGGGGGAGGGGAGGFGRGGGGFGPGGGSGAAGAGPGAASGAGARPGGMPGAGMPGGAGAAAAAGRGGMGGAPMGGAGRGGQGGEDEEHQRPTYLVEGDPDEVFGTNERTAPPVIGE